MRPYALDARVAEHAVVGVPTEDLVGEQVQVLVDAEAPLLEQLVERDTVRAIRLARQEVLLHRRCEPARLLAVLGRDDVVGDERAVEGDDRVAASRERPGVEADAVVHRPGEQRKHGRERERACALETRPATCPATRSGTIAESEQHGVARAHEREEGDAEADEREAAHGRRECCPDDEECPERERQRRTRARSRARGTSARSPGRGAATAATAIATHGPKYRAAAAQQTIEPA